MKNKDILNPPVPYVSPEAILVAKARMVYEQNIWHIIESFVRYYKLKEGLHIKSEKLYTPEFIEKDVLKSYNKWKDGLSNWIDGELWESFVNEDHFQNYYLNSLKRSHDGHCVGYPDTCERCEAEAHFNLKNSVTWNYHHGSHMFKNQEDDYDPNFK